MAEGKSRQKRVAQWVGTTLSPAGRSVRVPSPITLSGSDSEVHTAPSAVKKRKATAAKSSSRKVHEPGTGGLPESSDSDSEEEEEEDEDDDDSEDTSADRSDEENSEADSILESNDEFEGAVGGFPANVTKKSKKMWPKSPLSTVSTSSRKRTDWELVDRFDFTSKKKQAMRKVRRIFEAQMYLSGCSTELKTSKDYKTCGGWKRNKVFKFRLFLFVVA